MRKIKFTRTSLVVISLFCIGGLALAGFTDVFGRSSSDNLAQQPLSLDVPIVKQTWSTSCGPAVIAMTYNYAHPNTQISEQQVIEFAAAKGYYLVDKPPFTSPANMEKIAEYYTDDISSGNVTRPEQGLDLLIQNIRNGEPVVIDVLSNFSDSDSEAHFIVVTGISIDPDREDAVVIHYNDPLTGTKESADWAGSQGVWNAWQTNGDPGGTGWWMVISPGKLGPT
jgi:hypothetical protein